MKINNKYEKETFQNPFTVTFRSIKQQWHIGNKLFIRKTTLMKLYLRKHLFLA